MSQIPPRPQWNDPSVKEAAAELIQQDMLDWCVDNGSFDAETGNIKEFNALLALAVQQCPDAYGAGRYLDDFTDWPIDGDAIRILDNAYRVMPRLTAPVVSAWVMKYAVRLNAAKEDMVRFKVGDAEITGRVVDTLPREARCFAEVVRNKGQIMAVAAEDIIENLGPSKRPRKGTDGGGRYA